MAQFDPFAHYARASTAQGERHFTVTPSDSEDLPIRPAAIYVEASGNAVLRDLDGTDVTYAVEAGQILLFRPVRILATGTTATLIGWW